MSEPVHILQTQAGYKREFAFSEDSLTYKLRDSSGEREFTVPYETVDVSSPSTLTLNKTPLSRRAGVASFGCAIVSFLAGSSNLLPVAAAITLYAISAGLLFAVVANSKTGWLSAKFTVMRISPSPPGTNAALMVLHDDKHDEVIAALLDGWKKRVKLLYGRANLSADPDQETKRLGWLRDKGVIDEMIYYEEISKISRPDEALRPPQRMIN